MTALIYVDMEHVHPVINGVWHRAKLHGLPAPGTAMTMLCGESAAAEYRRLDERRAHGVPTACPNCDQMYRRQLGIPAQHGPLR